MIKLHLAGCTNSIKRRTFTMNYIRSEADGQLVFEEILESLKIPSMLHGFHNTHTDVETAVSGKNVFAFHGIIDLPEEERICSCGCKMHVNNSTDVMLRHIPFGSTLSCIIFPHVQLRCNKCGATKTQFISFKAAGHRITVELFQYVYDLLATGNYTNKEIASLAGLHPAVVKAIDKQRLLDKYTIDGKQFRKPEKTAEFLGIDEFKLHNGHKYATHIIDLKTGHVLFIAEGKKKRVVYNFIQFVGQDWMKNVKAVACDMNSDFEEAFKERCPHLEIVFDHFHIVKNFNDKVVSEIRKDEYRRLIEEGETEAAKQLKGSKYILTSKRATLQKKDKEALEGKVISKGSELFGTESYVRSKGYEARYDELLRQNRLLFTADLIKEKLDKAYQLDDPVKMGTAIADIVYYCYETKNKHFEWFGHLLYTHHDGIITYAKYKISSGKIEGINNKIKTIRRQAYGYPDDEYFFLKIMDASRAGYVRNPKSHRILH